ncbi:division/cell wall cluster transcriptional repressor MraZ [Candidatus Nomurabacteria bacterium]|nr:division/cell wall cluster transcriptional repressor MraZ [Candidatus Nomurabacteria bacterium]
MLIGQFTHTLDGKKRLSLPSKFRKELGKTVVITRGLDQCLFVYSLTEWKEFSAQLAQLSMGQSESRAFNRFLLGGAVETPVDSAGRILIPDFLKDFAGLETKTIVTGVHNRVEIWNEESWNAYTSQVEKQADTLAQKIGEIGMI